MAIPKNQLEAAGQIRKFQIYAVNKQMLVRLMTGFQAVVGNPLAKMMTTMKSNSS